MNKQTLSAQLLRRMLAGLVLLFALISSSFAGNVEVKHLGDGHHLIKLTEPGKYLLLPVEEKSGESSLQVLVDNNEVARINVRLAVDKIDYYVPLDLNHYSARYFTLLMNNVPDNAVCWGAIQLSDSFDTANREAFRPSFHFTPQYGWMNDPNGLVYKDGTYHLYYQYNPYASVWGNMHWGHATSTDLVHWTHQPIAIYPDALGAAFSGSAVVDSRNDAGFGKNSMIAFYASAGDRQTISMAYSDDNGMTFKKYSGNPVVASNVPDFRDPKVFYHQASSKWIMIVAAGQEMQFYTSSNLKDWTYESSFGKSEGCHDGVWECPDMMELPVEGTNVKKWVLICNINPGGPFGGSATQYFVGSFDGKNFVNDSPSLTKWMDYGKDHYATVAWNGAPQGRHIVLAWMSNWQYAPVVPTKQYRSGNSVPRELSLFKEKGETYIKCSPVAELLSLRKERVSKRSFTVASNYTIKNLLQHNEGAFEIEMTLEDNAAQMMCFELKNEKGEKVSCYFDVAKHQFAMDRTKSGDVSFSKDFPCTTFAPTTSQKTHTIRLFFDRSSIEIFGDNSRFAMTNLVFPSEPYNQLDFVAKSGTFKVKSLNIYKLQ